MIRHLRTSVLGRVGLATVLTIGVTAAGIGMVQGVASASPAHHHAKEHGRKSRDKSRDRAKVVGVVTAITQPVTSTSGTTTTTVTPGTLTLSGPGGMPLTFDLSATTTVNGPGDHQSDTLASILVGQRVRVVVSLATPMTTPATAASVKILSNGSIDH